jgi:hypothetical protein
MDFPRPGCGVPHIPNELINTHRLALLLPGSLGNSLLLPGSTPCLPPLLPCPHTFHMSFLTLASRSSRFLGSCHPPPSLHTHLYQVSLNSIIISLKLSPPAPGHCPRPDRSAH